MIIKFLEIFTEYVSIVLCIHKIADKKIKFSWNFFFDFAFYMLLMFMIGSMSLGKLILYINWFIYTKIRITNSCKQAIKPFFVTICTIPMLQLLIYAVIGNGVTRVFNIYYIGTIINILIIIFFVIWKEKYLMTLMNIVTKFRKIIFLMLMLLLFKYLISYFGEYKVLRAYFMDHIVIFFLILLLMLILWINAENEKEHKAEELRTYQLYTKTFEDAVTTIRMKQHEFDNHINAIKCMHYTIQDIEELFETQDKYCDSILQDNQYNKILKLHMSPILAGYLFSKFTAASVHDINIEYEIHDIDDKDIAINDLIEIIGILFDNAVEALVEQGDKEMEVKLLKTDNRFIISIANISTWKTNSEIEKFFKYGYSTKGQEHGIGLHRVNVLLKKYKASIQVENITKKDVNFLCFKVVF